MSSLYYEEFYDLIESRLARRAGLKLCKIDLLNPRSYKVILEEGNEE